MISKPHTMHSLLMPYQERQLLITATTSNFERRPHANTRPLGLTQPLPQSVLVSAASQEMTFLMSKWVVASVPVYL
jgi:hypothetical protein